MKVYETEKDGLPDMDKLTGRVAFIFDGCIVSGWPLRSLGYADDVWEANDDVGRNVTFHCVKKYVVFDKPIWEL